jgi:hypothetical protein
VKYPEAFDRQWKSPEFLRLDLPEIGASASIFLQISSWRIERSRCRGANGEVA